MAFTIIEVQPTPNPNAAKFVLNAIVSETTVSFLNPQESNGHPLAAKLFEIPGVMGLMFLDDFITVSKSPLASWETVRKAVSAVLSSET